MSVELVRSGGFANVRVSATLPADDLAPRERAGVAELLERPAEATPAAGRPDRYVYLFIVVTATAERRVQLGEHELDAGLRPLVDRLEAAATPG